MIPDPWSRSLRLSRLVGNCGHGCALSFSVVNIAILKVYTEGLGNDRKPWTVTFYLSDRSAGYLCFATGILVHRSKEIQGNKRKIKEM